MNKAIEYVWDSMSFPEEALLGKRVPKKHFLESSELVASDKKLFQKNVKNVYWQYTLKPETCPILPYKDNEREYLEVEVLQVGMNWRKGHKRIAEIIHRVIPYLVLLGFYRETDEIALSIAPKRLSEVEDGAFVAERFWTTGWMDYEALKEREAAFIASLAWRNIPLHSYYTLYNAWLDRFIGYECSVLSGVFTIGKAKNRLEALTRCREIESRISELRGQMKKAAFNRQVELNTKIKKFEQELGQLSARL